MAKGDVVMKFDADSAKAVQELMKLREKMLSTADATRKLGETGAKAGGMFSDAMSDTATSIMGNLGIVTSASAAAAAGVTLVFKSVNDHFERSEKRAQTLREQIDKLAGSLAAAGNIKLFPAISKEMGTMAENQYGGVSSSKAELSGVYAHLQTMFAGKIDDPETYKRGVLEYQKAKGAGLDSAGAMKVAEKRMMLAPLGLEDMAFAAAKEDVSEEEMKIVYRSKNKRSALNAGIAAGNVEEGSKTLAEISAIAEKKNITMEDVLATPEKYFPKKDMKKLQAVRNIARGVALMDAPPTTESALADAEHVRSVDLEERKRAQNTEVLEQKNLEFNNNEDLRRSNNVRRMAAARRKDHPYVPDFLLDFTLPGEETRRESRQIDLEWEQMRARQAAPASDNGGALRASEDPGLIVLNGIYKTLREQNSTLRTRRDTTLSNESEGQK